MQPKPIDSRRVVDIDLQKKMVDMEGFAVHLRSVREHKEHPAETDYDVTHDEQGQFDSEEASRESAKTPKREPPGDKAKSAEEGRKKVPISNGKGSHIDIEA